MPNSIVLTALEVEYLVVRAHLTDLAEETHPHGTPYARGHVEANGRTRDIVLAQIEMGNPRAAVGAEQTIARFDSHDALLVGVAGGSKDV